jgi:hypothetical protein
MDILHSIIFLAEVILLAICLTAIVECVKKDNEQRRLKRREKYRKKAYKETYKEGCKNINREWLSTVYLK